MSSNHLLLLGRLLLLSIYMDLASKPVMIDLPRYDRRWCSQIKTFQNR